MKAMAKSPDQRYATAEDLRADLLRFADGRPVLADAAGGRRPRGGGGRATGPPRPCPHRRR